MCGIHSEGRGWGCRVCVWGIHSEGRGWGCRVGGYIVRAGVGVAVGGGYIVRAGVGVAVWGGGT